MNGTPIEKARLAFIEDSQAKNEHSYETVRAFKSDTRTFIDFVAGRVPEIYPTEEIAQALDVEAKAFMRSSKKKSNRRPAAVQPADVF